MPRLTPDPEPPVPEGLGERVGLGPVLAGLDRRGRRGFAPGLGVRRALTWDRADRRDATWWPQGLTSSADAGRPDRLLVASWYSKAGLGTRVTFLDLDTRRYRHVPMALVRDGTLAPLPIHAGGLAWCGPWLYLAATRRGCYAAHVDDIVRRPSGELVWPVRLRYAADDGMRYSFLSVDPAAGTLLAGEYGGPEATHRLARFALDPAGLLALGEDGAATAVGVDAGVPSMQGAVRVGDGYRLMVSRGRRRPGDLWAGRPGGYRRRSMAAPPGPEDATVWGDLIWSLTEFPGRRWVFAVRA
jgi:hypothetical protein